jgi:hypothetical protein
MESDAENPTRRMSTPLARFLLLRTSSNSTVMRENDEKRRTTNDKMARSSDSYQEKQVEEIFLHQAYYIKANPFH